MLVNLTLVLEHDNPDPSTEETQGYTVMHILGKTVDWTHVPDRANWVKMEDGYAVRPDTIFFCTDGTVEIELIRYFENDIETCNEKMLYYLGQGWTRR